MAPFAGSLSALKRLVETHLREKEQASEMLKGYVTTITREVRSSMRHAPCRPVRGLWSPLCHSGEAGDVVPSNFPLSVSMVRH